MLQETPCIKYICIKLDDTSREYELTFYTQFKNAVKTQKLSSHHVGDISKMVQSLNKKMRLEHEKTLKGLFDD